MIITNSGNDHTFNVERLLEFSGLGRPTTGPCPWIREVGQSEKVPLLEQLHFVMWLCIECSVLVYTKNLD